MKSGAIGMMLVFCLVAFAVILGDSEAVFINVPSLIICIGLPIGLSLASSSVTDTVGALRSLRCLVISPKPGDITSRNAQVLRHMVSYSYAAGIIGAMIGGIQVLRQIDGLANIHVALSLSLLTLFYSTLISECILRPAARQIEDSSSRQQHTFV